MAQAQYAPAPSRCASVLEYKTSRAHVFNAPTLAAVPTLEVMDTSELRSLVELTNQERERVTELRTVAKAQQRKVLRVNCDLDLKRIDRLQTWIETVLQDSRRQW